MVRGLRFACFLGLSLATACGGHLASSGTSGPADGGNGAAGGGGSGPGGSGGGSESTNTGAVTSTIQLNRLAVDSSYLYWIDVQIHAHRMPNGGGTDEIIDGSSDVDEVAPGNGGLYYLTSSVNTTSQLVFYGASGSTSIPYPAGFTDTAAGLSEPLAFDGKHLFGGFGGGIAAYDVEAGSWSKTTIVPGNFTVVVGATATRAAVLSTKDEVTNDYYLVDPTNLSATHVATVGSGDWRQATFDGESLFLNSPVGAGVTRVLPDGSTSTVLTPSPRAITSDDKYLYASVDNRIVAYGKDGATSTEVGEIDSAGYSFTILVNDPSYVYGFATALDGQEGTIFRFKKP